jgi:hypothetical protein
LSVFIPRPHFLLGLEEGDESATGAGAAQQEALDEFDEFQLY